MSEVFCSDCVEDPSLGFPSNARWIGPDGGKYCSIHHVRRFGHGEKLVKIEGYEPPAERKPAAPKKPAEKAKEQTEVNA